MNNVQVLILKPMFTKRGENTLSEFQIISIYSFFVHKSSKEKAKNKK